MNSRTGLELSFLQLDAGLVRYRSLSALGEVVLRAPGMWLFFRRCSPRASGPMPGLFRNRWTGRSSPRCGRGLRRAGRRSLGACAVRARTAVSATGMIFAHPSGEVSYYDKRHLFRPGGEAEEFSRGNAARWSSRGVRFLLAVCYDLRFPVWSAAGATTTRFCAAPAWPNRGARWWRTLLCARALENQAWVVGANFCGRMPRDATEAVLPSSTASVVSGRRPRQRRRRAARCASWRMNSRRFRDRFPTWREADDFVLTQ